MAQHLKPRGRDEFGIAIVCAIRVEFDAVDALLDERWVVRAYEKPATDPNTYITGRIHEHNVVLVHLPGMGKVHSASSAAHIRSTFPCIELGLVVGVCGGVPTKGDDDVEIVLGDVIISTFLVQYDLGRRFSNRLIRKDGVLDSLGRPSPNVRAFLNACGTTRERRELTDDTARFLDKLCHNKHFKYPGAHTDKLFQPRHRHKHHTLGECSICMKCQNEGDGVCEIALKANCVDLGCEQSGRLVTRDRLKRASENMSEDSSGEIAVEEEDPSNNEPTPSMSSTRSTKSSHAIQKTPAHCMAEGANALASPLKRKRSIERTETSCSTPTHPTVSHESIPTAQSAYKKRKVRMQDVSSSQSADFRNLAIHFGGIASGDSVMKSGHLRDEIAAEAVEESLLAFEMEGAGVWDSFSTMVIKGICDYADSHKNKAWQGYAAASAAACAKAILRKWRVADRLPQAKIDG